MNYKVISEKYSIEKLLSEIENYKQEELFFEEEISRYANKKSKGSLTARYLIKKILINEYNSLKFSDISILNNSTGKPVLNINNLKTDIEKIHISISHTKEDVAVLIVIDNE